jgi:hypothetical protein
MKQYKAVYNYILVLLVVMICACTKFDDFKDKYAKGGPLSYPGIMDSVEVFSGNYRVQIMGLLISDPKIVEYRVFWNSKNDSIVVPVIRTSGVDTALVIVPDLPEGTMSFEIRTYDVYGNVSIPIRFASDVYGELYRSGLLQRTVKSTQILTGDILEIQWADVNYTEGIIADINIKYTNNQDVLKDTTVMSQEKDMVTMLPDYKAGTAISYRTGYIPTPTAIDVFYTVFKTLGIKHDVTSIYLKNYMQPFANTPESDAAGRWRTPADWSVTIPVLNQGGFGGWVEDEGTGLAMQSGWGTDPITDGKMFQTMTLPAGNYTFKVNSVSTYTLVGPVYIVAAAGNTLPDAADLASQSLGYGMLTDAPEAKFDFTLTAPSEISIGFVATMSSPDGEFWMLTGVQLFAQ